MAMDQNSDNSLFLFGAEFDGFAETQKNYFKSRELTSEALLHRL